MLDSSCLLLGALLLVAYLIGCAPFGLWAGRHFGGLDLRREGSGNIGATNAARVLGWRPGLLVLALDFAKGTLAVALAGQITGAPAWLEAGLGAMVLFGHVAPAPLRFRGGKGVATAAGALLLIDPALLGLSFTIFFFVAAVTRLVSVASMLAALSLLPLRLVLQGGSSEALGAGLYGSLFILFTFLVVILRHTSNIRRVLSGTELSLGVAPSPPSDEELC